MPNNAQPPAPTNAQVLAELRHAYYHILTGNHHQTVRFKEREIVYTRTDLEVLRKEIRRLEMIVAAEMGQGIRTVQAGAAPSWPGRYLL